MPIEPTQRLCAEWVALEREQRELRTAIAFVAQLKRTMEPERTT